MKHRTPEEGRALRERMVRLHGSGDFRMKEVAYHVGISATYASAIMGELGYREMIVSPKERELVLSRRKRAAAAHG